MGRTIRDRWQTVALQHLRDERTDILARVLFFEELPDAKLRLAVDARVKRHTILNG
jgi:hypothetical protein